jgi:hypothetical protein
MLLFSDDIFAHFAPPPGLSLHGESWRRFGADWLYSAWDTGPPANGNFTLAEIDVVVLTQSALDGCLFEATAADNILTSIRQRRLRLQHNLRLVATASPKAQLVVLDDVVAQSLCCPAEAVGRPHRLRLWSEFILAEKFQ